MKRAMSRCRSAAKEGEAEDYRYFPEPDLPPLIVDRAWVEAIHTQLPEFPDAKYERFVTDYGLSAERCECARG